jgi:diketogulonate reductase-like aldo/keto reductase
VSNFDLGDMQELFSLQEALGVAASDGCAANQVYYSLGARGIEFDLLPWQRDKQLPIMAYSPIDQGALAAKKALREIGARHGASAAQIALAWVLSQPGVIAIPKAVQAAHLRENLAAVQLELTEADRAQIERLFPPPRRKTSLAML